MVWGASTSSFTTKFRSFVYRPVRNLGNRNSPSLLPICTFQDSDLLTFNISAHHSWWGEHGPGCVRREMPQAPGVRTTESQSYITVMGCLLDYQYIEVAHSGAQILVAVSTCEKANTRVPHTHKHATGTHRVTRFTSAVGFHVFERWRFPCSLHAEATTTIIFLSVGVFPLFQILKEKLIHDFVWLRRAPAAANWLLEHRQGCYCTPLCSSVWVHQRLTACQHVHLHTLMQNRLSRCWTSARTLSPAQQALELRHERYTQ